MGVTLQCLRLTLEGPIAHKRLLLVSLSGMVETPRLQAKQVLRCRQATCHSVHRAGIQEIRFLGLLDAGSSSA
jgi:hypothetical protein